MSPPIVPAVTAEQMREVDRVMVEDLGISLEQMMENAGRNLAQLAVGRFGPASVLVLAGPGGNGGGGLVAARHLHNRGAEVAVVPARRHLTGVPAEQLEILRRMGVSILDEPRPAELYLDAIIGYGLSGDPRGRAAELITWLGGQPNPILSLDTPSGVDVTTGEIGLPAVMATATLTLAAPKTGLVDNPMVGELYLADISVPPSVYDAFGMTFGNPFSEDSIVRLA